MKHINTVFHQPLKHIPCYRFNRVVERYEGDRRVRTLNCWTRFVALIYAQLAQRVSLRGLQAAFNSHVASILSLPPLLLDDSSDGLAK